MKYHHSDAIGTLPIIGLFIARTAEEIGWGKLIVGALLTFVLTGIAWNLNSISTDIREIRTATTLVAKQNAESWAIAAQRMERIETIQKIVVEHNKEQDVMLEKLSDCIKVLPKR